MWNRKGLKIRAKAAVKANYWRALLVAIIISLVTAGTVTGTVTTTAKNASKNGIKYNVTKDYLEDKYDDFGRPSGSIEGSVERTDADDDFDKAIREEYGLDEDYDFGISDNGSDFDLGYLTDFMSPTFMIIMVIVIAIVFAVVFLIIMAIRIAFDLFVGNPFLLGSYRFFVTNLHEKASLKELIAIYKSSNFIKPSFYMVLKNLYVGLWSLLLLFPGIIKRYEYRMIPYLLAENPEMSYKAVFKASKTMMKGNKWKAFVLDLSFIGWDILSILTLGIVGVFWVGPYKQQTFAALYDAIKMTGGNPVQAEPADDDGSEDTAPFEEVAEDAETVEDVEIVEEVADDAAEGAAYTEEELMKTSADELTEKYEETVTETEEAVEEVAEETATQETAEEITEEIADDKIEE